MVKRGRMSKRDWRSRSSTCFCYESPSYVYNMFLYLSVFCYVPFFVILVYSSLFLSLCPSLPSPAFARAIFKSATRCILDIYVWFVLSTVSNVDSLRLCGPFGDRCDCEFLVMRTTKTVSSQYWWYSRWWCPALLRSDLVREFEENRAYLYCIYCKRMSNLYSRWLNVDSRILNETHT